MDWVEIDALTKRYSGHLALGDFNLTIKKGEFVSLLGPSGCGKTTTLRIIAGFESASSGRVLIAGKNLLDETPHRRGMGVVFQHYALFPHLSAAENVAFGMRIAKRDRSAIELKVQELLDLVSLSDAGGKYPRQMSGGQQQRIAVARALAIDPRMLLLDEPLSALDAVVRVDLRDKIREIQSKLGITTLFVTHDQEEALAISDRVVVMRGGRIEQVGTPEQIYMQPASRFVASFIGRMNLFDAKAKRAGQVTTVVGEHVIKVNPASLSGTKNGAAVTVLVRPEAVCIGDVGGTMSVDNAYPARIETVTFKGSTRQLVLRTPIGELIADVATVSQSQLRRGDIVQAGFSSSDCSVLSDSGEEGEAGHQ
ncbi:MAG: ABC transporter ATP-binding protein [Rhizobiaceae bacterium]|nr:ABC transporter ATP-binding protein [Rhizobiaceae bacterium]